MIKELKGIEYRKNKGARIRTKKDKFFNNEKPNRTSFNLERKLQQKSHIHTIIDKDENILEGKEDITEEITNFYTKFYTSEYTNKEQIIENLKHITKILTE